MENQKIIEIQNQPYYSNALEYAKKMHEGQFYGGKDTPYYSHPKEVVDLLIKIFADEKKREGLNLEAMVIQAFGHDLLEDTDATYNEISQRFGKVNADGIQALTKNKNLSHDERVGDSLARILQEPPETACVKMADRICNISNIHPKWGKEKHQEYLQESRVILETLGGVNETMARKLEKAITDYGNAINKAFNQEIFK